MGSYIKNPKPFKRWDSNTICDVTGFRVKLSNVERRWEGWMVLPQAWNPRQPQDFPVIPQKQVVYDKARSEQVTTDEAAQPAPPII